MIGYVLAAGVAAVASVLALEKLGEAMTRATASKPSPQPRPSGIALPDDPGVPTPGLPSVGQDPFRGVVVRVDPAKEPALATNEAFMRHASQVAAPVDMYAIGTVKDTGLVAAYLDDRRLPHLLDPKAEDVMFTLTGAGILSKAPSPVPGPGQLPRINDDVIAEMMPGVAGAPTVRGNVDTIARHDLTTPGQKAVIFVQADAGGAGAGTFAFPEAIIVNLGPSQL